MTGLKGMLDGRMSCQKMLRMQKIFVESRGAQAHGREILQRLVSKHKPHIQLHSSHELGTVRGQENTPRKYCVSS